MKNLFAILISLLFVSTACASWHGKIYDVSTSREISIEQLVQQLSQKSVIVLGETHITPEVQAAEAQIIDRVVTNTGNEGRFSLAWEFLSASEQDKVDSLYQDLKNKKIDSKKFLSQIVGNKSETYVPVIEEVVKHAGELLAINLTRSEKGPVTKGGIKAADPKHVPPGYETGGDNYYERFKTEMQDHVPADKIRNYFDAQCLTDDVMAYQVSERAKLPLTFIIAGHFHTDYFDGMVKRLEVRLPSLTRSNVRILDTSEYSETELLKILKDGKYGPLADYVFFVKEPVQGLSKNSKISFPTKSASSSWGK